ncbi:MAG: cell division protein FtsL [Terriglobia bacterium]|jgi:cell division protein FtsL
MNEIFYLKPVDNSRIRKPIDLRMSLQLGSWLLVASLLVMALLLQAWERVEIRQMGYQIENVRSETDTIQQENHLLLVERAALRSPRRIDSLARVSLGMTLPLQQQMIMLDSTHTLGEQPVMAQVHSAGETIPPKSRGVE